MLFVFENYENIWKKRKKKNASVYPDGSMDVTMIAENLQTTSGLSILLHGFISLPDAMPYDKLYYRYKNGDNCLSLLFLSFHHLAS